jgi:hypothetical protein
MFQLMPRQSSTAVTWFTTIRGGAKTTMLPECIWMRHLDRSSSDADQHYSRLSLSVVGDKHGIRLLYFQFCLLEYKAIRLNIMKAFLGLSDKHRGRKSSSSVVTDVAA